MARICGICPVAYQMSAMMALEQAFGVETDARIAAMRRVFYCGEWIQSHALHIHLLAAPDFLGFDNAPAMARDYPDEVRRGLELQAVGNAIIRLFGGRSVHPVGACVGGFHHTPTRQSIEKLLEELHATLPRAKALVQWTASPSCRKMSRTSAVCPAPPDDYPMIAGRMISSNGLDIGIEDFNEVINEYQVPHSTALHAMLRARPTWSVHWHA